MKRKLIGIILREFNATYNNIELYAMTRKIMKFLRLFNVDVIAIPVIFDGGEEELERTKSIIDRCDGIITPGGIDILGLDCDIVKYCYEKDIPTLGICLGVQIMGKGFNGEIATLNTNNHCSNEEYVHNVFIDRDSILYKILCKDKIRVNSRHHDYVKKTDLKVSAVSEEGIVEALEDKNKKFFLGVQWHPESLLEDENSIKLFNYFIERL